MLKGILKTVGTALAIGLLVPAAATAQMEHPASTEATITGTVIDLDCKFRNGLSGEKHRMCAQVCADNGLPLAILGSDGNLYMAVGGGMPGDPQNARLKDFAEQQVTITGKVYEAGSAKAIEIESIERTSS